MCEPVVVAGELRCNGLVGGRPGFHVAGKAEPLDTAELLGFLQVADKNLEVPDRGNFADGLEMRLHRLYKKHVVLDAIPDPLDGILGYIGESQPVCLIDSVP
jgi:hypothetical protein